MDCFALLVDKAVPEAFHVEILWEEKYPRDILALNISLLPDSCANLYYCREISSLDKVKEAQRRVMVANHPDAGGSHYLASKINEAKDLMLGKAKSSSSPF